MVKIIVRMLLFFDCCLAVGPPLAPNVWQLKAGGLMKHHRHLPTKGYLKIQMFISGRKQNFAKRPY
jgi:hypothetical protein